MVLSKSFAVASEDSWMIFSSDSFTDKPTKSSTDTKIADKFNHLEALLMARTLDKEPTFQTVKVAAGLPDKLN